MYALATWTPDTAHSRYSNTESIDRSALSAANSAKLLSASVKGRGACLKMSAKKAEIGKQACSASDHSLLKP